MCCAVISPHTFPFASSSPASALDSPCCQLITPLSKYGTPWPPSRYIPALHPSPAWPSLPSAAPHPQLPWGRVSVILPNKSLTGITCSKAPWGTLCHPKKESPEQHGQTLTSRASSRRDNSRRAVLCSPPSWSPAIPPGAPAPTHPPSCPSPQPGTAVARTLEPQLSC